VRAPARGRHAILRRREVLLAPLAAAAAAEPRNGPARTLPAIAVRCLRGCATPVVPAEARLATARN
jgi:hypothetical protein